MRSSLLGRQRECIELQGTVDAIAEGGGLLLIAGEAGVGKTRLAEEALAIANIPTLFGAAAPTMPTPYGPIVGALRSYLHREPGGLSDCGR